MSEQLETSWQSGRGQVEVKRESEGKRKRKLTRNGGEHERKGGD